LFYESLRFEIYSKKSNKPMELVIGKKFKMEVWEKCVKVDSRSRQLKSGWRLELG
jgi:hypothetical protein